MFKNYWLYDFSKITDDYAVLRFPWWIRVFWILSIPVAITVVQTWIEALMPLAWAYAVFAGMVALTEDSWRFNKKADTVSRSAGLLFLAKRWSFPLQEIQNVTCALTASTLLLPEDPYSKTLLLDNPAISAYALQLYDGRYLIICTIPRRRYAALYKQAERLAAFLGCACKEVNAT
ncbi:MAG TPA: hypothetical protein P5519_08865 [Spirochaetia bacterium]|nr:hypothetical protein [Spirochaetales bacterium]HRS65984.1 hypothetical protein [Spirochaetia bacterium]HPD80826.1 hypothetical protein [Spirochaetales bacterium]HQG40631.1 hypothetical protein [Spirochaetales bacterium]HQK33779.1 hypothetical protein [Spirochaetales bacterium]